MSAPALSMSIACTCRLRNSHHAPSPTTIDPPAMAWMRNSATVSPDGIALVAWFNDPDSNVEEAFQFDESTTVPDAPGLGRVMNRLDRFAVLVPSVASALARASFCPA